MTYESDSEGTLQTVAREGDTLAVGTPIARVGETAGDAAAAQHNGSAIAEQEPTTQDAEHEPTTQDAEDEPATQDAEHEPATQDASNEQTKPPTVAHQPTAPEGEQRATGETASPPPRNPERLKASPLARRIARETGVDLGGLTGSGPGGRIVKADVEVARSTPVAPATLAPVEPSSVASPPVSPSEPERPSVENVASAKGETTTVELSRMQRTIARRMAESKATIPDFTLSVDIDMERCVDLRAELKRLSRDDGRDRAAVAEGDKRGKAAVAAGDGRDRAALAEDGQQRATLADDRRQKALAGNGRDKAVAPTYNDMIVKACALALREHPRANASYRDGRFELHARVNVGVAVAAGGAMAASGVVAASGAAPTGGALVVPTVFDADTKALGEIARETRALAERVREGSITPPELSGGTFTVSNLGMYGIRQFTAIVNPPQAAILAVGAVAPRPVARKKKLVARQTMSVTLACDHRILYGADAALFLARIRELLEEPAALTL